MSIIRNRYNLFTPESNPAIALVNAINPYSRRASSREALALIDQIEAGQLSTPCDLVTQMAFTECELEESVERTLGTQCLIYLFDPGNGWLRDSNKRGDMLLMTAKLVEKGVSLVGLYYYRGNPVVPDQSIKQTVQSLINRRNDDPPATLNAEIIRIFTEAGYEFSYPSEDNAPSHGI